MKSKILFFLLISGLSFSQQKNVTIKNLAPQTESFAFPVVSYSQNPRIENKINTFLQVDQLENVPSSEENAITGKTSYSKRFGFYNWEKMDSPKNILSIAIEGEISGTDPVDLSIWRNFDLRTGNLINAKDLFQSNSIKIIENFIQKSVKKEINDFLVQLKSEKNPSKEVLAQISLYENCFTGFTLDGTGYYFAPDKIRFIARRCANHAMRQLDELDYYVVEFPYRELDQYWSPYAKNLLSGSEKVDKTSVSNKLYKGKIDGKYPITVLIDKSYDDGSVSAKYWYDKNKKLIEWHGNLKGNHFSLIESDYYSEETRMWIFRGLIEADLQGSKIVGTWQDYKSKKYLNLELEEL